MCNAHAAVDFSKAVSFGTRTEYVRIGKDGGVTVPETGRVWLDCPACGAQPPHLTSKVEVVKDRGYAGGERLCERTRYSARLEWLRVPYTKRNGRPGFETRPRGACAKCGSIVLGRVVVLKPAGANHEKCNGACLSGRSSCSCHCGGRCHGAGVCTCSDAAVSVPSITP